MNGYLPENLEPHAEQYPLLNYFAVWNAWSVDWAPNMCMETDGDVVVAYGPFKFLEWIRDESNCTLTIKHNCDVTEMVNVVEDSFIFPLLMHEPKSTCVSQAIYWNAVPQRATIGHVLLVVTGVLFAIVSGCLFIVFLLYLCLHQTKRVCHENPQS